MFYTMSCRSQHRGTNFPILLERPHSPLSRSFGGRIPRKPSPIFVSDFSRRSLIELISSLSLQTRCLALPSTSQNPIRQPQMTYRRWIQVADLHGPWLIPDSIWSTQPLGRGKHRAPCRLN